MDSYYHECRRRNVDFDSTTCTVGIETGQPADHDQFNIQATFNFYCQHKYRNWILRQDSTDLEFVDEVEDQYLVTKSIQYNSEKGSTHCKNKMHRRVFGWLKDFSLPTWSELYKLAKVISETWDIIVEHLPQDCNNLKIDFGFAIVHNHIFHDENIVDIHRAIRRSMQEAHEPAMVPATDASIECLKSKMIDSNNDHDGSCRICLEDFEQAVLVMIMPCSHVFHKDCIRKWLKASHYCPICRYQMPTN
ncbi:uncharacterized protein [Henckelia pumila]|uniref:uncharacterized protein n=1 Tax=Henckelia pumila TaxID=405737 RepID=UPI003C6E2035